MDKGVIRGFAAGFVVVAALAGVYAWRSGQVPGDERRQDAAPNVATKPSEPAPGPDAGAPAAGAPARPPAGPDERQAALPPQAGNPPGETTAPSDRGPFKPPSTAQPPATEERSGPDAAASKASFDIVRVEPSGEMVIAGRCAANCVVELLSNGEPHDKAAADSGGNWAMTPQPLPPGEYELGLKVTGPDGKASLAEQTVTVAVPKPPSRDVLVVVNEPNAPSRILQKPETLTARAGPDPAPAGVAAGGGAALSIAAVDAENGRFFAQGLGPAGVRLRIYLNNAPIADAVIGRDGRWSLRVERGLSPGEYVMRLDALDPASGKVAARAETKFAYAPEIAAATPKSSAAPRLKPAPPTAAAPRASAEQQSAPEPGRAADSPSPARAEPQPSPSTAERQPSAAAPITPPAEPGPAAAPREPDAANPVVASIDTATVRRGDSLWRISRSIYGQGRRFTVIFEANGQIRNPNLIYPGQVLVLPTEQAGSAAATVRP